MFKYFIIGYIVGATVAVTVWKTGSDKITIVRSSDSDWEISEHAYPDTVIKDTILLPNEHGRYDTLYPTRFYKNISR